MHVRAESFARAPLFATRVRVFSRAYDVFSHRCEIWAHGSEVFSHSRGGSGNDSQISRKSCEFCSRRSHSSAPAGAFPAGVRSYPVIVRNNFARRRHISRNYGETPQFSAFPQKACHEICQDGGYFRTASRNLALVAVVFTRRAEIWHSLRLSSHGKPKTWHSLRLFSHGEPKSGIRCGCLHTASRNPAFVALSGKPLPDNLLSVTRQPCYSTTDNRQPTTGYLLPVTCYPLPLPRPRAPVRDVQPAQFVE